MTRTYNPETLHSRALRGLIDAWQNIEHLQIDGYNLLNPAYIVTKSRKLCIPMKNTRAFRNAIYETQYFLNSNAHKKEI